MDVVDCFLAEPALRELSVQAADLEPVDGLQPHHSQSWIDVVVDAHAVIANGVGTDVATSGEPLFKVLAESQPATLYVRSIDNRRLKSVHRFYSLGL